MQDKGIAALDWRLWQVFLAAAEAGSLGRAAVLLGDSQPTMSRRLARLESQLGQPLFERTPRGLVPTAAGRMLLEPARQMRGQVARMALELDRRALTLAGTVRITASEMVSQHLLLPALRPLRERHPEIQIELAPGDEVADLLARQADIALRMFRPREDGLIARRLADLPLGLFAHRDYLAARGPVTPQTMADHAWIGDDRLGLMVRGFRRAGYSVAREFFAIRTDHSALAWQAVCEGLGIGAAPLRVGGGMPGLERVLPELEIAPMPCWLVAHRELRGTPRLRAVFDALAQALG